jgi:predicted N-acetyltransferase YhbS
MVIKKLSRAHDRASFDCGEESLNDFLQSKARQWAEKGMGITRVALLSNDDPRIVGYYTLAAGSVEQSAMPKRVFGPRELPIILLGRLAVDIHYQGSGIGEHLLIHALQRAERFSRVIGASGVVVDALHDRAEAFYKRYGFVTLIDREHHLYMPMEYISRLGLND